MLGRESDGEAFACVCVCVCVCVRARVCVCVSLVDDSLHCKAAPFSVCCVHLAVLGTI
jgi:hypothetical protein